MRRAARAMTTPSMRTLRCSTRRASREARSHRAAHSMHIDAHRDEATSRGAAHAPDRFAREETKCQAALPIAHVARGAGACILSVPTARRDVDGAERVPPIVPAPSMSSTPVPREPERPRAGAQSSFADVRAERRITAAADRPAPWLDARLGARVGAADDVPRFAGELSNLCAQLGAGSAAEAMLGALGSHARALALVLQACDLGA